MKVLHFLKKFSGFLLKKCFVSMSYWNEWVIGLNIWKKTPLNLVGALQSEFRTNLGHAFHLG